MSKKELTHEDALAQVETTTKARKAARAAIEAFEKENGLRPKKNHAEDAKHGKAWSKLHKVWADAKAAQEAAEAKAKELKPKTERVSKYEYPADVTTSEQKKKYRAAARAKAKADKKAAEKGDAPKKDKKAKKEEAPAAAAPAEKTSDKKKKKKAKKED